VREGETVVDILHLARGVAPVPGVERNATLLAVGKDERQLHGADDRKASRLIARIDVRDVGNAVARHVVVIERAAELLAGKQRNLD
jgi:hypothetical protein